ncbi:hypothetical protein I8751_03780 [Nostocaceae cyanobacterium CENA357]|uniref:Uncharacterized protein n=1 Tax=Atlanticothrix silvestris CENA357 TaxID=1725252 RepID=A0A8J7KWH4_9CYAN|nr:hypothetical protein [Atlanticothrix silvestris]MBH8551510.1 hypothetical protein [Atlanticothrix silvestris CENA357]
MSDGNRNNTYNIYLGAGGNFNNSISIEGNYLQVHGNYTNISQDLYQATTQIQELLHQLENQGYSRQDAQQKVAKDWANEVKKNPTTKGKLVKLGQSIRDAAANAVIGEATLNVIKLVFASLNIPLPF